MSTAAVITAVVWSVLAALGAWHVRRDLGARRSAHAASLRERERRDALGLEWVEMKSEQGVELLERDGDRWVTRETTLESWRGGERLTIRGGVAATGHALPIETLTGIGDVCVLARRAQRPDSYREDAGPIVLEPDPEHGYRFGYERDPAPPRSARRYASFFAIPVVAIALAFVPYLGAVIALVSVAVALTELVILARTRILGALTFSALALLAEGSDERARRRAERAREREWD